MSITVRKLADGRVVLTKPEGASFALTPEQQQQVVQLLVNAQNGESDELRKARQERAEQRQAAQQNDTEL